MVHWIDLVDLVDWVPTTRRGWKRLAWVVLAAGVIVVCYLLWNSAVVAFGWS